VIRAVIDTNVLVSGLLSPAGNPATVLLAVRRKQVRPCFSAAIFAEYAEVLARPKFAFDAEAIEALLAMLRDGGVMIVPAGLPPVLPDPDDAKFLQCAQAAGAECIVTGNKRHFPPEICDPIRAVNAGELLDRIAFDI
jgi:putative PIN family toxin of toxin-antitoxin system